MKLNKKTKLISIVVCCVLLTATLTGVAVAHTMPSTESYIGEQKAKTLATQHAGVDEQDVSYIYCRLDNDDRTVEYDVEFVFDNTEYDYEINATTGDILSFDKDVKYSYTSITNIEDQNYIGEEQAKSIALEHAQLSENDVSNIVCKLDYDDGVPQYELEFWSGSIEYDYEIDATTGAVKSYDHDIENSSISSNSTPPSSEGEYISSEQATTIALQDANVNAEETSRLKCEFDYDDGHAEYEVEWDVGKTEYEYTISAVDGSIWKRDIDTDN